MSGNTAWRNDRSLISVGVSFFQLGLPINPGSSRTCDCCSSQMPWPTSNKSLLENMFSGQCVRPLRLHKSKSTYIPLQCKPKSAKTAALTILQKWWLYNVTEKGSSLENKCNNVNKCAIIHAINVKILNI